jgi:hypothetical protein
MYKLQSVLFSREGFNLEDAVRWLFKNGFEVKKIDATQHYWRFRQHSPSILRKEGYTTIRTKDITPHIKYIFAYKDDNNAPASASISV